MTILDSFPSELQPDADHATDADLYSSLYEYAAGLEARLDVAAGALVCIHEFIEAELDPDPVQWADYYGDPSHQALVASLPEKPAA